MSSRQPRTIRLADDVWATVRHVVEVVAIVAAGLWGFYVFIYQERIKPASEPAALAPSVAVERVGRDARRDVLRISVTLRNTGKTEFDIAADAYNVWGERYGTRQVQTRQEAPNARRVSYLVPRISRTLLSSKSELRDAAVGGLAGFHVVIEPGAQEQFSDVLVVPRGTYDVISAQTIDVPVKMPVRERVRIELRRLADGSVTLVSHTPGVDEDDNDTQFALIP
ncbi:MAG TPA: hypothetical protein VHT05_14405 [Candidatus Elarobacter sp.]|nr:hypothetical protein [Candidatus Elarobacter sp.]